jgi:hypothetical protein
LPNGFSRKRKRLLKLHIALAEAKLQSCSNAQHHDSVWRSTNLFYSLINAFETGRFISVTETEIREVLQVIDGKLGFGAYNHRHCSNGNAWAILEALQHTPLKGRGAKRELQQQIYEFYVDMLTMILRFQAVNTAITEPKMEARRERRRRQRMNRRTRRDEEREAIAQIPHRFAYCAMAKTQTQTETGQDQQQSNQEGAAQVTTDESQATTVASPLSERFPSQGTVRRMMRYYDRSEHVLPSPSAAQGQNPSAVKTTPKPPPKTNTSVAASGQQAATSGTTQVADNIALVTGTTAGAESAAWLDQRLNQGTAATDGTGTTTAVADDQSKKAASTTKSSQGTAHEIRKKPNFNSLEQRAQNMSTGGTRRWYPEFQVQVETVGEANDPNAQRRMPLYDRNAPILPGNRSKAVAAVPQNLFRQTEQSMQSSIEAQASSSVNERRQRQREENELDSASSFVDYVKNLERQLHNLSLRLEESERRQRYSHYWPNTNANEPMSSFSMLNHPNVIQAPDPYMPAPASPQLTTRANNRTPLHPADQDLLKIPERLIVPNRDIEETAHHGAHDFTDPSSKSQRRRKRNRGNGDDGDGDDDDDDDGNGPPGPPGPPRGPDGPDTPSSTTSTTDGAVLDSSPKRTRRSSAAIYKDMEKAKPKDGFKHLQWHPKDLDKRQKAFVDFAGNLSNVLMHIRELSTVLEDFPQIKPTRYPEASIALFSFLNFHVGGQYKEALKTFHRDQDERNGPSRFNQNGIEALKFLKDMSITDCTQLLQMAERKYQDLYIQDHETITVYSHRFNRVYHLYELRGGRKRNSELIEHFFRSLALWNDEHLTSYIVHYEQDILRQLKQPTHTLTLYTVQLHLQTVETQ